ncbi:uncharacterized protein BXZ73DRAFT_37053 [Epithele typhae]|uniref:uncharacterized protein n=1 Tax=Epithele typhae TaxID=378194 RepID=UPI002008A1C7|nr:uncharacterized protein BXZ73DRAFT_37053 [Epithele typhae]KAH9946140.1 hypothetical protein BXZ73DRAFT_37053 [Epithele typhae]
MSTLPATDPDFDFWEFVHCGICHLEFFKEPGTLSAVPFWVTQCGHVVCNNHLNADQSCAQCGSQDILVGPLAREMDPPMSDWFRSVPQTLDAVGCTIRLQLDTMANLVRYFKKKYFQYRPMYDRLKQEFEESKKLRRLVEELRAENHRLKQRMREFQEVSNPHNKRMRLEEESPYNKQRTSSSRSTASASAPVAPNRLTLPADHHQPQFAVRQPLRVHESYNAPRELA